jgi:hypothetical protein
MSPTLSPVVRTALTLAESLQWTDLADRFLDEAGLDADDWTPVIERHAERISLMLRLADSRFNPVAFTLEDSRVIE